MTLSLKNLHNVQNLAIRHCRITLSLKNLHKLKRKNLHKHKRKCSFVSSQKANQEQKLFALFRFSIARVHNRSYHINTVGIKNLSSPYQNARDRLSCLHWRHQGGRCPRFMVLLCKEQSHGSPSMREGRFLSGPFQVSWPHCSPMVGRHVKGTQQQDISTCLDATRVSFCGCCRCLCRSNNSHGSYHHEVQTFLSEL
jgi:hypothetical protein